MPNKEKIREYLEEQYPGAMDHVRELLKSIGEDPDREGLKDTPYRVVKSFADLYGGYGESADEVLATFFEDGVDKLTDGIIMCDNISFFSTCEHHMIPFYGICHIGYIPDKRVVGVSKMVRLVEAFARRLQIQEMLCCQIAEAMMKVLKPKGVAVVMTGKHLCMTARGVKNATSKMTVSETRGVFRTEPATRAEFFDLIKLSSTVDLSI
jgi:GTP cyclohydrolase I